MAQVAASQNYNQLIDFSTCFPHTWAQLHNVYMCGSHSTCSSHWFLPFAHVCVNPYPLSSLVPLLFDWVGSGHLTGNEHNKEQHRYVNNVVDAFCLRWVFDPLCWFGVHFAPFASLLGIPVNICHVFETRLHSIPKISLFLTSVWTHPTYAARIPIVLHTRLVARNCQFVSLS